MNVSSLTDLTPHFVDHTVCVCVCMCGKCVVGSVSKFVNLQSFFWSFGLVIMLALSLPLLMCPHVVLF